MTGFDAAAFRHDGFGTVRAAVSPAVVANLVAAVERVQAGVAELSPDLRGRLTLERDLSAERRGGTASSVVGDAIFILGDPASFDTVFLRLLDAAGIVGPVREALDATVVAAHFMNVTIKHPRWGRALGWHRNFPNGYACPAASRFLRAMLCLDGMDETSGATTFVPGSHLIDDEAARAETEWRPAPPSGDVVAVHCGPGDLVLIHPKVLHGGGMNTSGHLRRNVVLQAGDALAPLISVPEGESVTGDPWERPCMLDECRFVVVDELSSAGILDGLHPSRWLCSR